MSVTLVDDIVDKHYIEIDPEMIRKVKVSWFPVFLLSILASFCLILLILL